MENMHTDVKVSGVTMVKKSTKKTLSDFIFKKCLPTQEYKWTMLNCQRSLRKYQGGGGGEEVTLTGMASHPRGGGGGVIEPPTSSSVELT